MSFANCVKTLCRFLHISSPSYTTHSLIENTINGLTTKFYFIYIYAHSGYSYHETVEARIVISNISSYFTVRLKHQHLVQTRNLWVHNYDRNTFCNKFHRLLLLHFSSQQSCSNLTICCSLYMYNILACATNH